MRNWRNPPNFVLFCCVLWQRLCTNSLLLVLCIPLSATRPSPKMEDALPPLGVAEVLPVVGMLLAIAIAILYGCGCLGSGAAPSARPAPGSGSKGFVRNPEGFQDDDDDEDSEDEKDR